MLISLSILLPSSASPVRLSLLIHNGKNYKFPFGLQSLNVVLIFPKCSSLYIILMLKILSSNTSFYSLLLNSLIWYSRAQPTSPILPTGARNMQVGSGGKGTQSGPAADAYAANHLPSLSHRFLSCNFGITEVPALWIIEKT